MNKLDSFQNFKFKVSFFNIGLLGSKIDVTKVSQFYDNR